jgi:hypothetical protein
LIGLLYLFECCLKGFYAFSDLLESSLYFGYVKSNYFATFGWPFFSRMICPGCGARIAAKCHNCHSIIHHNTLKNPSIHNTHKHFVHGGLVFLVVDALNVPSSVFFQKLDPIIVLNKVDLLPPAHRQSRIEWLRRRLHCPVIPVSAVTGEGISLLLPHLAQAYKSNKHIHVIGHANVGKSCLVNALRALVGGAPQITTSAIAGTTRGPISTPLSIFAKKNQTHSPNLYDTAGIIKPSCLSALTLAEQKLVTPKKQIKPRLLDVDANTSTFLAGLVRIDALQAGHDGSLKLYMAPRLDIKQAPLGTTLFLKPPSTQIHLELAASVKHGLISCHVAGLGWFVMRNIVANIFSPHGQGIYMCRYML